MSRGAERAVPVLAPGVPGAGFDLDDARAGRIHAYGRGGPAAGETPLLLVHSVNAAASAYEIRPVFEHYAPRRPTYAFDLPGFGLSDRSDRVYTPRLMTDAVHVVAEEIRRRHDGVAIDVLALSLATELVARAANEAPGVFRSMALVSPTGFNGRRRHDGPTGSTRAIPGLYRLVSCSLWDDALYRALTRPKTVRYFLERTWGGKNIDEGMWAYDVVTVQQPGAKHAPLYFVSGGLFSKDVSRLYDGLEMPVWMSHGVRGDFVNYRLADAMRARKNWHFDVFPTGALPYFEAPREFIAAYDAFLAKVALTTRPASESG